MNDRKLDLNEVNYIINQEKSKTEKKTAKYQKINDISQSFSN